MRSMIGHMKAISLLVRKSLKQHFLSTLITIFSVALATGLLMAVFAIDVQARTTFLGDDLGVDAILGARGSKTQLILNAFYHLDVSPGNIPWNLYQGIKRNPMVKYAIPYVSGDNYYNHPIIGTNDEIFQKLTLQGEKKLEFQHGKSFEAPKFEAVIGSYVAQSLKLKLGDTVLPYHGFYFTPGQEPHKGQYKIVGILKPTNTPLDRIILVPLDCAYRMEGHVLKGAGEIYVPEDDVEIPDEHKEVSAVLVKFRGPHAGMFLSQMYNNQGDRATLAWPIKDVMLRLMNQMGWITKVIQLIAYLVMIVVMASIIASIYNTMNERKRDFAILRSLGAKKRTLFSAIIAETTAISLIGTLLGYVVYGATLMAASIILQHQTGLVMTVLFYHDVFWITPLGMFFLGIFSGIAPAIKAYRTDISSNLNPVS